MTREQLDALVRFVIAAIEFKDATKTGKTLEYTMASSRIYNLAYDALYATIEKHTPLENVTDAELCGQVED